MTTVFSTYFRDALFATPTLLDSASVGIRLFRSAPSFSANDARYSGITTAAGLTGLPGWSEVVAPGYPLATTVGVSRRVNPPGSTNNYILLSLFSFTGLGSSIEVEAVAYYYNGTISGTVNPLIMITDTPFSGQRMVVSGVDGLTSNPDTSMAGANRWLFSWATPAGGAPSTALIQKEGPLAVLRGAPAFETSHTQHVWLYPQRVNLIANPSFEKDTAFWLSNRTITRVAESALGVGSWAGRFAGTAPVVAESNIFDTQFEERWTVQLMAKGNGNLKVGFVWWDGSFEETAVDWGTETWKLDPTNYTRVAVARTGYQTFQGLVRLECDGNSLTIDNVLVEKGYLKDWPYFDGDTTYGARDDFTWYGGSVNQGASYSLWYNNKRATYGRLFAQDIEGVAVVTDEVMTQQGFVYQWVPAGMTVQPHIDVLYPHDLQLPPASRSGTVLHYRASPSDLQGVVNPW